jgi:hypothetical protein
MLGSSRVAAQLAASQEGLSSMKLVMGKMIGDYSIFVRKPEEKMSLEIHKSRWENNIEMDLRELGYDNVD